MFNLNINTMKKHIFITLISFLFTMGVMAQKETSNVKLYNKSGKIIINKQNINLKGDTPLFSDLMTPLQFDTLSPDTYFFLIEKGEQKRHGFIRKKTSGFSKVKYTGLKENLLKSKLFFEIDGKKIPFKGDTTIKGMYIKIKKHRFIINGKIDYAKKISLWCSDKEYPIKNNKNNLTNFSSKLHKGEYNTYSGFIPLCKHNKNNLIINIDGRKTKLKDNMNIGNAKVLFRKNGLRIKNNILFKKEISIIDGHNDEEIWYFSSFDTPEWDIKSYEEYEFYPKGNKSGKREKVILKTKNYLPTLLIIDDKEYVNNEETSLKENQNEFQFFYKNSSEKSNKNITLKTKNHLPVLLIIDGKEYINDNSFKSTKMNNKEYTFFHKNKFNFNRKKIVLKSKNYNPILLVVDGKSYINENGFKEVSPDSIKEIQILKKGTTATALFGEKGKNGVIFITTKK